MPRKNILARIGKSVEPREYPELRVLMERIAKVYSPQEVLLFGSRAKGTQNADSDWDLIVVLKDEADEGLLDPMLGWETQRGSGVFADLVCVYASEFISDAGVVNTLTREVMDDAVPVFAP